MKKSIIKSVFVLIVFSLLALSFCACSKTESEKTTETGYTVSGKITLDGQPLADVSIITGAKTTDTSDDSGIFLIEGLSDGDVLNFSLDGYVFNPSKYTVKGNDYELRITATVVPDDDNSGGEDPDGGEDPGDGGDPDDGEDPGDGGNPDDGDGGDSKSYFVKNAGLVFENGSVNLSYCVTKGFESVTILLLSDTDESVLSTPASGENITINGEDYVLFLRNVTNAVSAQGEFSFSISAYGTNNTCGNTATVRYTAHPALSSPSGLWINNNVLHWIGCEDGVTYNVAVDGVSVAIVTATSFDFASLTDVAIISGSRSVTVIALKEGYVAASSDALTVTF